MSKSHASQPNGSNSSKKKKSSLDYPSLAKKLLGDVKASGDAGGSKLPTGEQPQPLQAGLYIVATPIGHLGDITLRALTTLAQADIVACEDTRNSGALLSKYGVSKKPLLSYHDHNEEERLHEIMRHIEGGKAVALISDAGMPLIADPGYRLVRACREAGLPVTVIPGANAAITALAGSGLPTDRFSFIGFLPPKTIVRRTYLEKLKTIPVTLVFYEAPQRLADSLRDMKEVFGGTRLASVARELTKLFEETRQGNLEELATFYSEATIKGEIVIIVAPPLDEAAPAHDLDALLLLHLENDSVRDAAAAVAAITGMRKSEVYARALELNKKNSP